MFSFDIYVALPIVSMQFCQTSKIFQQALDFLQRSIATDSDLHTEEMRQTLAGKIRVFTCKANIST